MAHDDFHYSHLFPKKPPIAMCESVRTVTCPCGATFATSSRVKRRCDTCQSARKAQQVVKWNEKHKAERKARRKAAK